MGFWDNLRGNVKSDDEYRGSRSDAIKALSQEYVDCGGWCDRAEVEDAAKRLGLEDASMVAEVISKLNIVIESARGGNPDAIKKAEELRGLLPEVDGLVDRIIADAKEQAKQFGYTESKADGFINVGDSMKNYYEEAKEEQGKDIVE